MEGEEGEGAETRRWPEVTEIWRRCGWRKTNEREDATVTSV